MASKTGNTGGREPPEAASGPQAGRNGAAGKGERQSLSEEVHSLSAELRGRLAELWSHIGQARHNNGDGREGS